MVNPSTSSLVSATMSHFSLICLPYTVRVNGSHYKVRTGHMFLNPYVGPQIYLVSQDMRNCGVVMVSSKVHMTNYFTSNHFLLKI